MDDLDDTFSVLTVNKRSTKKDDGLHYSNFFITVNTNRSFTSDEESKAMVKSLRKAIKALFSTKDDHQFLSKVIKFLVPGHVYDDRYIVSIKVKFTVEKGKKFGRIHAHIWVSVVHRSMIHLDREYIIRFLQDRLGLTSLYVNIRIIRKDPFAAVEKYLEKDPQIEDDTDSD